MTPCFLALVLIIDPLGGRVTEHLLDLGHRDIAFLFPETASNDRARDRLAGAQDVLKKRGLELAANRLKVAPYDIGEAKAVAIGLLSDNPPTAVVCGNDIIAQGVVYACQALGVGIPDALSIIGIGDFRGSAHMEPGLTTLRLPASQIGQRAADTILKMSLSVLPPSEKRQNVETTLVERGSTKNICKT